MPLSEPAGVGLPNAEEPTSPSPAPVGAEASVELTIDSELQPGSSIGEYVVDSKIGQGGMASVYAGSQPVIGKKVAVKVMSRHLCLDPLQVERFVQEARAVNQIGHPNIVDVFAFGALPDGRSYLVMEWLAGETLASRLKRGWLSVPEAVAIIFQICDGLAAAHDKGIVHRDLKPENIFLVPVRNRRMLVKLLDFGIAKLLGRRDMRVDRTAQGSSPGTPGYMSPEQARGKEVDHRTDIYSLGVTAYEMLLGRVPFAGAEAVDVLYQHIHAVPPAPSTLRPDIPLQLERLLLMMLEKKADRRPTLPVVEERLAELRDHVLAPLGDTGPVPLRALEIDSGPHRTIAPPPPKAESTDEVEVRRGPSRMLIVGAALLIVALAFALFAMTRHKSDSMPQTQTQTPTVTQTQTKPATATATATTTTTTTPTATATPTATKPARRRVKPAAPAKFVEPPAAHSRDYFIDPFAVPKK
jgi:serine/threonine protein kinase